MVYGLRSGQLKTRGRDALNPADFITLVATDYIEFLQSALLPLLSPSGTQNLYVAGVSYPVVEDECLLKLHNAVAVASDLDLPIEYMISSTTDLELCITKVLFFHPLHVPNGEPK